MSAVCLCLWRVRGSLSRERSGIQILSIMTRQPVYLCVHVHLCSVCEKWLPKCPSAHATPVPDFACVLYVRVVVCVCVCAQWGNVLTNSCLFHTTSPPRPPRATMLLTAAPPQTQTGSDGTGSPPPLLSLQLPPLLPVLCIQTLSLHL